MKNSIADFEKKLTLLLQKVKALRKSDALVLNIRYWSRNQDRPVERTIIVTEVLQDAEDKDLIYINAVCTLRNEERWFRLDRIESFYDDVWENELNYDEMISTITSLIK